MLQVGVPSRGTLLAGVKRDQGYSVGAGSCSVLVWCCCPQVATALLESSRKDFQRVVTDRDRYKQVATELMTEANGAGAADFNLESDAVTRIKVCLRPTHAPIHTVMG